MQCSETFADTNIWFIINAHFDTGHKRFCHHSAKSSDVDSCWPWDSLPLLFQHHVGFWAKSINNLWRLHSLTGNIVLINKIRCFSVWNKSHSWPWLVGRDITYILIHLQFSHPVCLFFIAEMNHFCTKPLHLMMSSWPLPRSTAFS